jgi:hypothetical protein
MNTMVRTQAKKRKLTAKQREQLRLAREAARESRLRHVRWARYWLKDARRELRRGDTASAFQSALIGLHDRGIAHDYGSLVRKYEEG